MPAKPFDAPAAPVTFNSSTGSAPVTNQPMQNLSNLQQQFAGQTPQGISNLQQLGAKPVNIGPTGDGSKPAWEGSQPRNPYIPNNGNPAGANNMRRPPGEYDRRPRPRINMPGQPGYNSRMPVRGIEQPGMEMFDQDSTGRMTVRQNPRPGLPSTGFVDHGLFQQDPNSPDWQGMYNQRQGQQPGWNGPGNQPQGRYGNNPYRPGNADYYGGQSDNTGRYRPPMMDGRGGWQDYGGFNYNLPNAFGSYPGYGQGNPYSQFYGSGYEGMYGNSQGNPYGDFMSFYQNQYPYGG